MKTKRLVYCALFAAVTGILSVLSIPTQPVPTNMAIFGVLLAGGMLGKKYGTLSVAVYILSGAVGTPVFAGFRGGLATLAGPTGGYIAGYIIIAFLTGFIYEKTQKLKYTLPVMLLAVALCYAAGTTWYCLIMHSGVLSAFTLCVLPFIPADIAKIVMASIILKKYKRRVVN